MSKVRNVLKRLGFIPVDFQDENDSAEMPSSNGVPPSSESAAREDKSENMAPGLEESNPPPATKAPTPQE